MNKESRTLLYMKTFFDVPILGKPRLAKFAKKDRIFYSSLKSGNYWIVWPRRGSKIQTLNSLLGFSLFLYFS